MINKNKKIECHTYKVIHSLEGISIDSVYPIINMEIDEQASLTDHLYAFERFLQGIGFSLPENSHLDFVENESEENRNFEDLTVIESENKNSKNGTN
jgi:hypothetical protein